MKVLGMNATKFSFSSNLTQEIDTCDPIDFNYNYPNCEEDKWIIMQQCLDKDSKIVISKVTPSDIKSIFKLKDLAKRSEIPLNFVSIWTINAHHCHNGLKVN